ncbi:GNAT family N-acetyltransferase [Gordonia sp. PP30]|uniref:GNAT family N-acetyltransferase n=1 Tax=Gordonia sp. PP30 TaxID=2935861 RepID=UPI001FFE8F2D|nr:GNAT family N-acetyltransferase [Gordonia sp. PP30]UQE73530.1 GNAT family N-acetyltransferase [Gordonia sp. PP30]
MREDGRVKPIVHSAATDRLDAVTLYRILRLRVDVFVVEQDCPYPELDGRDLEPATRQFWCADDAGEPIATARLLRDDMPGGWEYRVGRLATAPSARGTGVTTGLMEAVLAEIGERPSVLDAQSHLTGMYQRFGYAIDGPEFIEDGIPHTPMRRG